MAERKELFTINGFTVRENSNYVVRDKRDLSAPSGFIEAGASKLPSDGIDEVFHCRYVVKGANGRGVWDTGFYKYSPCYENQDPEAVSIMVENLQKKVVEPYRAAVGDENALSQNDDDWWTKQCFRVHRGQVFNTNNPESLLELYFALRTFQLTPKGQEGDSKYNNSSYIVVDINKDIKTKDEKALEKFKAIGVFTTLLEQDKEKLFAILEFIGMPVSDTLDDTTLIGMFDAYLGGTIDKSLAFNNVIKEVEKEVGLAKVNLFKKLKEVANKSDKISKSPKGIYFYDGVEIGEDLKAAAENIAKNKNLNRIKKELLLLSSDED